MSSNAIKFTFGVLLICFTLDLSNSAFIDTLSKCGIKDNNCQRKLFKSALQQIGKTGIPEVNIPPIDPIQIQGVSVVILNLVNITLIDGVVKGIKDCEFTRFDFDIEKGRGSQELQCDITIKGHYSVVATSPEIGAVLGGSEIVGDGNGKVKIDKLVLAFDYPVHVYKKDDGEIYIKCDYNKTAEKFDILGKVTFAADNLYLGKENVSEFAVNYLNNNWKFIFKTFGRVFIDKATEFYNRFEKNFFDSVPAKHYISDDLTPYL
ncbi:PREDICTED: uncharacterized protein LOC106121989 [Papilio xuthus]|uniref:Uncharacterized protein LOC106121989 n=1 Tax=Papilio xuthus TaxID=66420 RepID=A0AAJ6ZIJ7_PAPXU|nr:PREDICTED: uncharacterized protein LOC106121989 [Papilio xuthus]